MPPSQRIEIRVESVKLLNKNPKHTRHGHALAPDVALISHSRHLRLIIANNSSRLLVRLSNLESENKKVKRLWMSKL